MQRERDSNTPAYYPYSTNPVPPAQRAPSLSYPVPSKNPGEGGPVILPPTAAESKRDRKRRETINKIELLHDESWRTRDEKFSALYREYHTDNKAVNKQPPQSAQYDLRLYPKSLERDALFEATEVNYQYKLQQAKRAFEAEKELIEAQFHEARDQVRQRLLAEIEDRRRKLREEKEGGDNISGTCLLSCRACANDDVPREEDSGYTSSGDEAMPPGTEDFRAKAPLKSERE